MGNSIESVILDVGHTLIRPHRPVEEVIRAELSARGIEVQVGDLRRGMARGARFLSRVYGRDNSIWVSEEAVSRFWFQFYALVLGNLGLSEKQIADIAPAIYDYFQKPGAWAVFPDVWPGLDALKKLGVRLGVISDWGDGLTELLHGLGLSTYFDFVVCSAVVGVAKPDPTIFRLALARAGVPPERAIYVGDAYPLDVIGARAAGIAPILMLREGDLPPLDCPAVRKLPAVTEILA